MFLNKQDFQQAIQAADRAFVVFAQTDSVLGEQCWQQIKDLPQCRAYRVDTDKEKDLAADLNIRVTPIVHEYQKGTIAHKYRVDQLGDLCSRKS